MKQNCPRRSYRHTLLPFIIIIWLQEIERKRLRNKKKKESKKKKGQLNDAVETKVEEKVEPVVNNENENGEEIKKEEEIEVFSLSSVNQT